MRAILVLVALAGCQPRPAAEPAPSPVPTPAAVAPVDARLLDAEVRQAPPTDLPPLAAKPPGPAARDEAATLVHAAWRAQDGFGDAADPRALAVSAVRRDPSSSMARLALACVFGDEAFALAQLAPLADAKGCRDCGDALRDLDMPDTHECKWSPAVRALARRVVPSPQRAAAEALMATLHDGDPARVAAAFRAPRVELVVTCSNCSDATHDQHTWATGAAQLARLVDQVVKSQANDGAAEWIVVGDGLRCAGDCCRTDIGMLAHEREFFSEVCFAPGTALIRKIELIGG